MDDHVSRRNSIFRPSGNHLLNLRGELGSALHVMSRFKVSTASVIAFLVSVNERSDVTGSRVVKNNDDLPVVRLTIGGSKRLATTEIEFNAMGEKICIGFFRWPQAV